MIFKDLNVGSFFVLEFVLEKGIFSCETNSAILCKKIKKKEALVMSSEKEILRPEFQDPVKQVFFDIHILKETLEKTKKETKMTFAHLKKLEEKKLICLTVNPWNRIIARGIVEIHVSKVKAFDKKMWRKVREKLKKLGFEWNSKYQLWIGGRSLPREENLVPFSP